MAEADTNTECGFCLRVVTLMEDIRELPCKHIHCLGCLTGSYEMRNVLQCPLTDCKQVFDVLSGVLPVYSTADEDSANLCCSCTKKEKDVPAIIYCPTCGEMYCVRHQELHSDLHSDHATMSIGIYKSQAAKLMKKSCETHTDLPYVRACRECLSLMCVECLYGLGECMEGRSHDLITVEDLSSCLKKEMHELIVKLLDKEERMSSLYKRMARLLTDHNDSSKEMVETLRTTRDEQLKALRLSYDQMEKELVNIRTNSQTQMRDYVERVVNTTWSNLTQHRFRVLAKLQDSHQVDIIQSHRQRKGEMLKLIEAEVPVFEYNCTELKVTEEKRGVEVELREVCGTSDGEENVLREIQLITHAQFPARVNTVCKVGNAYSVGLGDKRVVNVDDNFKPITNCKSYGGKVGCISRNEDRVCTLTYGTYMAIFVTDHTGHDITSWFHPDTINWASQLAIVGEKVAVPDRTNKHLRIYSLDGILMKVFPCRDLTKFWVTVCAVGDNSIVVADNNASWMKRIDVVSGEELWSTRAIGNPGGITRYKNSFLLVYSVKSSSIHVLDVNTGDVLSVLEDDSLGGEVQDLCVSGDVLAVAQSSHNKVLFYRLKSSIL